MAGCMYKRAAELYPAYTVTGYGAGGRGVGGTRGVQRAAAQRRSTTYYVLRRSWALGTALDRLVYGDH